MNRILAVGFDFSGAIAKIIPPKINVHITVITEYKNDFLLLEMLLSIGYLLTYNFHYMHYSTELQRNHIDIS